MTTLKILSFDEISLNLFYDILALRCQVFCVEQQSIYQDLDYKDQIAQHVIMQENQQVIAYARILPYGDGQSMSFGRLVTNVTHRKIGLGKQLMDIILSYLKTHHPEQAIIITAQYYLRNFYQEYGFEPQGDAFQMDGIPHIIMKKQP